MLIDMMKDVEPKAGDAAPPPEPRRLAAADKEVVQMFVARLRRQILQEIEEKAAEPPGWHPEPRSTPPGNTPAGERDSGPAKDPRLGRATLLNSRQLFYR